MLSEGRGFQNSGCGRVWGFGLVRNQYLAQRACYACRLVAERLTPLGLVAALGHNVSFAIISNRAFGRRLHTCKPSVGSC